MSTRVREHLRSNVVGYVAIFLFAVGGTAIAANTVRSEDIVNGEVRSLDVANNNLQGVDVRNDSLTGSDVVESTLGEVPLAKKADSVSQGGVTSPTIRTGAVTPAKLSGFPAVSVLRLSAETTHSGQSATLHPDFEVYDTDGLHDGSSEFLIAPVTGTYYVSATIGWDANSTGYRNSGLYGPSGTFANVIGPPTAAPGVTYQNLSGSELLQAGQSVHIEVLQGSGSDLNVRVSRFNMTLVGKT